MKTTRLLALALVATSAFISCTKSFTEDSISNNAVTNESNVNANTTSTATTSATIITNATNSANSNGNGNSQPMGACNESAYAITLESHTQLANGNWEWIWSVQNTNPGNGTNGTVQNLSHWGMEFGTCFSWSDVSSAAISTDGTTWNGFTPAYAVDPSQNCQTTPVLKFDYGTVGAAKSYYKLVLTYNYAVGTTHGYYKSGARTACCTFDFSGIACGEGENPR